MYAKWVGLVYEESAQAMVEYAFVIALVALAAVATLGEIVGPIVKLIDRAIAAFSRT